MVYVVTSYYRGAMHVDNLRSFPMHEENSAREYYDTCKNQEGDARAYLVKQDNPPQRMKLHSLQRMKW